MSQKIFHHSPHRAVDSMKILVGNKTNATIRDFEETEEDIEELTGVVISIDKDKINGNGWEVKDDEGNIYYCNIAFNLYDLPETKEYGGVYYPTEKVTVKFTKNPVLRTNTITEVTSLGKDEEKIDLSKWKHGDKPTTIIGKAKSAISISDSFITFNYDNTNVIKADEQSLKMDGEQTDVNSNNLNINSNNINIQGDPLEKYIYDQTINALDDKNERNINGMNITQNNGLSQLNILKTVYIPAKNQRVLFDLMDPRYYPDRVQAHLLLTGNDINKLYIYPNGLVSVQSSNQVPVSAGKIQSTINWITPSYSKKNVLTVTVRSVCGCCDEHVSGIQEYFNYCPHCKTWNTLYESQNIIKCDGCSHSWCPGCGHLKDEPCGSTSGDLKPYSTNKISGMTMYCHYCKDKIPTGLSREYANYCPKCHKWGYLRIEDDIVDGEQMRFLHCDSCNESYCLNCSISQGKSFITNFLNDNTTLKENQFYTVDDFNNRYYKLTHIRDEQKW